jgi:aminopeptidase N
MRLHNLLAGALLALIAAPAVQAQEATPAPAPSEIAPPLGKLPNWVQPVGYRLDLTIDPSKERFSGKVEIDARIAVSAVKTVFLHGRDLKMRRAEALVGGKTIAGVWEQVDDTGTAALRFPAPLPAGPVTFTFEYDAAFNDSPAGLFRVKVGDDWYAWSQFQSIDGRAAFPSFDEPGFKVPFTVTMRTPPGLKAISNAPEISTTQEQGLDVHRYDPTLPLPTYLVAMMVGPFVTAESTVPPTPQRATPLPLRIVTTKQNADKMSFAMEGSKEIVAKLESYFDQAFPYPKLDQITSPIMPGAMENAGADLYNDNIIILDDKATPGRKRQFGMIVAHELGHQWFGDLVTPAWWSDIWLNESFANWMGYRIGNEWRPDLKITAGARAEGFNAMYTDSLLAGRPIRQTITKNSEIDSAFDSITYGKGGQVVSMIAAFMGDEKFRDGVRKYMAKYRNGNASSDDFFAALAEAAGDPRVVTAMRSFTDQQGVPVLSFSQDGDRWKVSQSRYAPLGVNAPPARWTVPMCARRGEAKQCLLLADETAEFLLGGNAPLMPNVDGASYYRFELPARSWDALIAEADQLSSNEALALEDSLEASFRAGRASASQMLALARKLVRNPDSQASEAAGDILELMTRADLVDATSQPQFREFAKKMYGPVLKELGLDLRAGAYASDDPDRSQRRATAVQRMASWGKDRALRKKLADAARKYLNGDVAALDPAWHDLAFDAWLDKGGLPMAKMLADKAVQSQDNEFRGSALGAVATSGKEATANWLLNDFTDKRLRKSEQRGLLRGVLSIKATRDIGYRWLQDNLDKLIGGSDGIFFGARMPQMLNGFCSVARADEFQRVLVPRFAGKPGELELARTIERVRNCGNLKDARTAEVSAAFGGR